jgi:tetratricopeptide (TPR) repeat protein
VRYSIAIACCAVLVTTHQSPESGLSAGSPAHAQDHRVDRRLRKGQAAFQDQEYQQAIRQLTQVVDDNAATTGQRARALELIGLSHFILGDRDKAGELFLELVVLDPGYELADDFGSQDIRGLFERVKNDFLEHNAPVKLAHQPPSGARAGRTLVFDVRVEIGRDQAKTAMLYWRRQGDGDFQNVAMTPTGDDGWRGRVALPNSKKPYVLEYYIDSHDLSERPNGRLYSPTTPHAVDVAAGKKPRSWYQNWYVVVGGVAIIGITTAMIIAAN